MINSHHLLYRLALVMTLIVCLAACRSQRGQTVDDLPTAVDLDALATALPLTQFAPPTPYNREVTAFASIDNQLNELPGWRYVVTLEFRGVFAGTTREANATARAEVSFNQLASARRVVVSASGDLLGSEAEYEAVRLGPDSFLVRDQTCLTGNETDAATAANLSAGDLIGGAQRALPAGERAVINGVQVYRYQFAPEDLVLPSVRLGDNSAMTIDSRELWIAPEHGAVVRFYLNLSVENASIFDLELPVTGQILIRYDLYDVGTAFNLTVPFGC